MNPAIDRLPAAFGALLPELATLELPAERTATCATCVMVAPRAPAEVAFHAEIRCCTYHPRLPNFLVGRILRSGGVGAEKVRARIALDDGVTRLGVDPPAGWTSAYDRRSTDDYGRAGDLVCPYWAGGELACSIWQDRGAVCRTWFCRHDDGHRGHATWAVVRRALRQVEIRLAAAVAHDPVGGWEAYFVRCAEAVDVLPVDDSVTPHAVTGVLRGSSGGPSEADRAPETSDGALGTPRQPRPPPLHLHAGLEPIRAALAAAASARTAPIPDHLEPTVEGSRALPNGRTWLWGYSAFDGRSVDAAALDLLRRLEERRPWREIVDAARADGVDVDEGLVADLFAARIVGPRA